jgi:nicotinamide-nucleotide amidase
VSGIPPVPPSVDLGLQETAARCLDLLRARKQTLATAESLTAGLVAATLASVPGASDVLRGGLVAYATDIKLHVLGVDPGLVASHGVVSAECAIEMAERARALLQADWGVSTTGVAGPTRQDDVPVGRVFVGVAGPVSAQVRRLDLAGARDEIRLASVRAVLDLTFRTAAGEGGGRASQPGPVGADG